MTQRKNIKHACLQVASVWFGFTSSLEVATDTEVHAHKSGEVVERNTLNPARNRTCPVLEVEIQNEDRHHQRQGCQCHRQHQEYGYGITTPLSYSQQVSVPALESWRPPGCSPPAGVWVWGHSPENF